MHYPAPAVARRRVAVASPEILAAEAAVEPQMVPRRAVRAAAAVQSDAEAGTRYRVDLVAAAESEKAAHPVTAAAPDAAVVALAMAAAPDAAATVEMGAALPAAAAGAAELAALVVAPVPAMAVVAEPDALVVAAVPAVGAAVPDGLVVAAVPPVAVVAEPDAATGAAAPDALVVAAVPPVAVVAEPAAGAVELDAVVAVAGSAVAAAFSPFPGLFGTLERSQTCHRRTSRVLVQEPQTTRS